jgi:hypothetical protein
MNITSKAKLLLAKLDSDPNFVQRYYRVTNLSICPYLENAVYTEYEFLNDSNFDIWEELKYIEISKEEFYEGYKERLEREDEIARKNLRGRDELQRKAA